MGTSLQNLKKEQEELAKKVIVKDLFGEIRTVAGCDQAFFKDRIISAVVVCDYETMDVLEKKFSVIKESFPYIPGYLSYREGPAIIKTYKKLKKKPDILLVDGNGILHKLRIGLASHIGVLLDIPTIGVAKSLLCGDVRNKKVFVNNEIRGFELQIMEKYKPLYISPGHRVGFEGSVRITRNCIRNHKLPEPLRMAHLYANEVKRMFVDKKLR